VCVCVCVCIYIYIYIYCIITIISVSGSVLSQYIQQYVRIITISLEIFFYCNLKIGHDRYFLSHSFFAVRPFDMIATIERTSINKTRVNWLFEAVQIAHAVSC
jgi:hypothetical protein